jgi:hypothetical protein
VEGKVSAILWWHYSSLCFVKKKIWQY